jgi:hypothetical protein
MKNNQNGFGIILSMVAILVVAIVAGAGFLVYRSRHKAQETASVKPYDSQALMTVTSSGGLCNGPCNHTVHNLYDNGKFEDYKKLSSSEISQLKNIIEVTDFTKYGPKPNPHCQSFVDGSDQVLLFPQKYGNKAFTTCMLDIPENDKAFSYINELLESHYIQQN